MDNQISNSEISDTFLVSKVQNDQQSLQILEDAINSLTEQHISNTVDKQLINWEEDYNDDFLQSNVKKSALQHPIKTQEDVCCVQTQHLPPVNIKPQVNLRELGNFEEIKQYLLPILAASQLKTQTHFCTALRVLSFVGNQTQDFINQEIKLQFIEKFDALKDLIPASLSISDGSVIYSIYKKANIHQKLKILQYIEEFLQTANYFMNLPIYLGQVQEYEIKSSHITFNKQLFSLYEKQITPNSEFQQSVFQEKFEQFLFNNIKTETNSSLFCQLLISLKIYATNFTIFKPDSFFKLLIYQTKRITASNQITALIIDFLFLTSLYIVPQLEFENFIQYLLSINLDQQNIKAIKLAIQKANPIFIPEINQMLQTQLILSNFTDFLPFFDISRNHILISLEHGNFHNLKLIPLFSSFCDENQACRAFSALLVKLKSELVFVQKLKIAASLLLLLNKIKSEIYQETFNKNLILSCLSPKNIDQVDQIYSFIKFQDLSFVKICGVKSALFYCLYDFKKLSGQGFQIFTKLEIQGAEKYYKLFQ
ncbi:hypothetical protein SS50377_22260 [Spironucleus salmonicida]|uniref:Uncharacterized protein n=1 Tax=Spironucleus salmonicida TaxID=348837 RepID=V6LEZ3_9EUKA|nr:hypothetical protein SS50377_22260 [Spironucleus salmonicida]|eukprot:EST42246.1 Hypothetical protein SS50377_18548 [Spironucleus salmonicida]